MLRPKLFEFDDYRSFLKDWIEYLKIQKKNFSYRALAKEAGSNSPGFFQSVISGERNILDKNLDQVTQCLDLSSDEGEFFKLLVQYDQTEEPTRKSDFFDLILKNKNFQKHYEIPEREISYFSLWYMPVIREIFAMPEAPQEIEEILQRLQPRISERELTIALKSLEEIGFLKQENGAYQAVHSTLVTSDQVQSKFSQKYYSELLKVAQHSILSLNRKHRRFRALTLTLGKEDREWLDREIDKFEDRILDRLGKATPSHDRVAKLCMFYIEVFKPNE